MITIIKMLSEEIGPRGAGSKEERKAAEYILKSFEEKGLKSKFIVFKTIPTFSYTYILVYSLAILGIIITVMSSIIGIILMFISFILNLLEEEIYIPILTRTLSILGRESRNVIGILNEGKEKKIAIIAHYDSTKASYSFHPKRVGTLKTTIRLNFLSLALINVLALVGYFTGYLNGLFYWLLIISIPLFVSLIVLMHREIFHKYVPGANDNASGVAVLIDLIDKLKTSDKEIWFIATGSEEAGMIGMYNMLKHLKGFYIINIDNIGAGRLYYTKKEGIIIKYQCKGRLKEIADEIGKKFKIEPVVYSLLPTDATPAIRRGFTCITIIALDNRGIPENYHWYNDKAEYIKEENLIKARDFVLEIVNKI
ncbi:MAG: M28 family peptidase [Thermoprotei archaeon]